MNNIHAYVRIAELKTGSFPASSKATIISAIGSPQKSFPNEFHFKNTHVDCQNHIWDLRPEDLNGGTFKVTLFKRRRLKGDQEIGTILLNISAFPTNTLVRHSFTMSTPFPRPKNPIITLEVHVTDDPAVIPFNAPSGKVLPNFTGLNRIQEQSHTYQTNYSAIN